MTSPGGAPSRPVEIRVLGPGDESVLLASAATDEAVMFTFDLSGPAEARPPQ